MIFLVKVIFALSTAHLYFQQTPNVPNTRVYSHRPANSTDSKPKLNHYYFIIIGAQYSFIPGSRYESCILNASIFIIQNCILGKTIGTRPQVNNTCFGRSSCDYSNFCYDTSGVLYSHYRI